MRMFLRAGPFVFDVEDVSKVDFSEVEGLKAKVWLRDGSVLRVEGSDVIELALLTRPSVLEGRRMRWARHAWAIHNLVAHPLMQVLAFVGYRKLGVRLHDATIPNPRS